MKTLITAADIEYLLTQQEKLDKNIREKKGISQNEWLDMDDKHYIALSVEKAEFINECHDLDNWKYWKSKPVDREKIIDEAIDVIHFVMLIVNKMNTAEDLHEELVSLDGMMSGSQLTDLAIKNYLKLVNDLPFTMYTTLRILDHYSFTSKDIIDAYNRKNKINFERMAGNY